MTNRWTAETRQRLRRAETNSAAHAELERSGQTKVHVLPNAGHWLHVDNPRGLMAMMLPSFANPKA